MEEELEQATFPTIARKLLDRFYLQPYRNVSKKLFKEKSELRDGILERGSHGGMHGSRTAMWVCVYRAVYNELGDEDAKNLTGRELALLQIAALMHDAARGNDGHDWWDEQSTLYCKRILLELGCSEKEAVTFSQAISNKDTIGPKNIIEKTVHDVDCSEIVRVKSLLPTHVYDLKFLDIYCDNSSDSESVELICRIAEQIRQVIRIQHDQKWPNYIKLNGNARFGLAQGTLDKMKKLAFEQADNCYLAVCETLNDKRFALLKKYFDRTSAAVDASSFNIKGLSSKPYVQQLAERINEKLFGDKDVDIHEMKINNNGDFCLIVCEAPTIKRLNTLKRLKGHITRFVVERHFHTQLTIQGKQLPQFFHMLCMPTRLALVLYENALRYYLEPDGCLFIDNSKIYVFGPKHKKEQKLSISETKQALKETVGSFLGGFFGQNVQQKPEKIVDSLMLLLDWQLYSDGPKLPGFLWEHIVRYLDEKDCEKLKMVSDMYSEYGKLKNV